MSVMYWIERREVGHPRYRVWRKAPTFAAMLLPEIEGVRDRTEVRCEGKFLTRWGAERYIKSVTWTPLAAPDTNGGA